MKTWRPASWSQQAREMCDRQVEYINAGHALVEDALHLFGNSYRESPLHKLSYGQHSLNAGALCVCFRVLP